MDYKKKYEEAERLYRTANADQRYVLESLFPKLRESEDERIRKEIIRYLKRRLEISSSVPAAIGSWIAWLENIPYTIDHEKREGFHLGYKAALEKQGEQKPADKDMIEALRTEYEKGRADVIADTLSWLENCWPRYCSNQTIIEGFKEAIKGE